MATSNGMNEINDNSGVSVGNDRKPGSSMAIPLAIIFGFAFIAISIYLTGGKEAANVAVSEKQDSSSPSLEAINPVTKDDHIRGNPNAPLLVVEYSDYDCPFCKSFHVTMQKIMDEYGPSGKVAWVYRHLPLPALHPSAAYIAEASECVAELGGNEAFWKFSDSIFGERDINDLTNTALLPDFAVGAGVNAEDYESCMASGRNRAKVEEDTLNGQQIGAKGTPFSVVVAGDQKLELSGAQPYATVKLLVDGLLK